MRIALAVETWGAAHRGDRGVGWWIARGLAATGHSVTVITTRCVESPPHPGVAVQYVAGTGQKRADQAVALRRAAASASAMPEVQQALLSAMGSSSESRGIPLEHYDLVVGVGVRSPHVRLLLTRALGRTPTVLHLTDADAGVCGMPLARQCTVGHRVVTHWRELQDRLAWVLHRGVDCVPPNPSGWIGGGGDGEGRRPADRYVLLVDGRSAPSHRSGLLGQPSLLTTDLPVGRFAVDGYRVLALDGSRLEVGREDGLLRGASALLAAGDVGDFVVCAARVGVPVVVAPGSPGWSAGSEYIPPAHNWGRGYVEPESVVS